MNKPNEQNGLKKVLGLWDLMGIGIGQIIGSGIMALTGITIALTGAGTPLAFLAAAVLVICPNLVLAVLGSAVPATGGMYTYVRDYIGRKTGFFYLALLVAGQLVLAMFAITFAEYACSLVPGLSQTWVLLTVFYIVGAIPILTGLDISTIARLGNGVSLVYVLFPIFTGYLIYRKNPTAMENSTFKIKKPVLFVLTTVALIGYVIAALLNFSDISSAWQMMLIFSAVVIVYAWLREKKVKEISKQ